IVSPINGRVGLQQVNVGNYVTQNEPNGLVVVTQLQPITVVFTLPEDEIPGLLKQVHAGATLPVTAYDRSNTHLLATGTLQSIARSIPPPAPSASRRCSPTATRACSRSSSSTSCCCSTRCAAPRSSRSRACSAALRAPMCTSSTPPTRPSACAR